MTREIPERDWKVFRDLRPIALVRLCDRILAEARARLEKPAESSHEKYLALYRLIRNRDKDIGRAFNDFRRSTALVQIGIINGMGLLTPEELQRFSSQTLEIVKLFSREHS